MNNMKNIDLINKLNESFKDQQNILEEIRSRLESKRFDDNEILQLVRVVLPKKQCFDCFDRILTLILEYVDNNAVLVDPSEWVDLK